MTEQQAHNLLDAENDASASETFNGSLKPGDFWLSPTKAAEFLVEQGCDEMLAFEYADSWCAGFDEGDEGASEDPRASGHGNSLSYGGY